MLRYKGQTKYVSSEVADEAKAVKALQKFRKDVDSNLKPAVRKKLSTYYAEWMDTVCSSNWKPSTFDTAQQTYRLYIANPLGGALLGKLEPQDIQRVLDVNLKEGLSVSTVKHIYTLLKNLFTYAYQVGHIQVNPMDKVRKPQNRDGAEVRQIEVFEDDEVTALEQVAAMRDKRGTPTNKHANLIILMLNTGIRRGELLGLKWESVDFENKVLHITNSYGVCSNPDTSEGASKRVGILGTPKSKSGVRAIPLNGKALAALRQYEADWGRTSEFIAVTASGKQIHPTTLPDTLSRMAKSADVQKAAHLHMLRHTFATRAIAKGVSVEVVSKWLGHSNPMITYRVYVHVLKSVESSSAGLLELL